MPRTKTPKVPQQSFDAAKIDHVSEPIHGGSEKRAKKSNASRLPDEYIAHRTRSNGVLEQLPQNKIIDKDERVKALKRQVSHLHHIGFELLTQVNDLAKHGHILANHNLRMSRRTKTLERQVEIMTPDAVAPMSAGNVEGIPPMLLAWIEDLHAQTSRVERDIAAMAASNKVVKAELAATKSVQQAKREKIQKKVAKRKDKKMAGAERDLSRKDRSEPSGRR
ncbi:hypothetical protein BDV98DRAFT_595656 [Pterulicium gracile]|uniref:Uncharacterized protein n=1 Tax=Pterulicium gracile TaxID=1884261 RepID=A0A5C3QJB0_9AGAR|nr:hypothetical protein BDV98DRAFT_595656 [Pterula gracilis]